MPLPERCTTCPYLPYYPLYPSPPHPHPSTSYREMYKMPMKASFCNDWYAACYDDYFCSVDNGNFFSCAEVRNVLYPDTRHRVTPPPHSITILLSPSPPIHHCKCIRSASTSRTIPHTSHTSPYPLIHYTIYTIGLRSASNSYRDQVRGREGLEHKSHHHRGCSRLRVCCSMCCPVLHSSPREERSPRVHASGGSGRAREYWGYWGQKGSSHYIYWWGCVSVWHESCL